MPQLDRFLAALVSHRASALMLVTDAPAQLDMQGTPRAITKAPLSEAQLLTLLQELAPGNARMALDSGAAVTFGYTSDEGAFTLQVSERKGGLRAVVRVEGAASAPPTPEAAPQRASAPVAAQPAAPATTAGASPGAASADRDRIEGMLRTMIERGSSDLHLRVGEPPIVRVDGEMVRLPGTQPLSGGEVEVGSNRRNDWTARAKSFGHSSAIVDIGFR